MARRLVCHPSWRCVRSRYSAYCTNLSHSQHTNTLCYAPSSTYGLMLRWQLCVAVGHSIIQNLPARDLQRFLHDGLLAAVSYEEVLTFMHNVSPDQRPGSCGLLLPTWHDDPARWSRKVPLLGKQTPRAADQS